MNRERLLVAVNGKASRAHEALEPAFAVLRGAGFDLQIQRPEGPEDMLRLLRDNKDGISAVIVAGGDGTVHAALPALVESGSTLGILPCGTANDLALTLGIPSDPQAAAQVIVDNCRRRIDLGNVNGIPFINVGSIGLAVQVAQRQRSDRKRHWGKLSYALTVLEVLGEADRFDAVIYCDNQAHHVNAYQIAVGNGVYYGGGMAIAEDASIDDGLLDVYAIETRSIGDLIALAPALFSGRHAASPHVSTFRCRKVRILTEQPTMVSTDGEVATETPAEFTVSRRALEVLAPPP